MEKINIKNYTKVDVTFFNEIYFKLNHEDNVLKIIDHGEHPEYYILTDFLMSRENKIS